MTSRTTLIVFGLVFSVASSAELSAGKKNAAPYQISYIPQDSYDLRRDFPALRSQSTPGLRQQKTSATTAPPTIARTHEEREKDPAPSVNKSKETITPLPLKTYPGGKWF